MFLVAYGCSGELRPRSQRAEPTVTEIKRVYEVANPKPVAPVAPAASTAVAKVTPKPAVLERGMRMSVDTRRELRALAFLVEPKAVPTLPAAVPAQVSLPKQLPAVEAPPRALQTIVSTKALPDKPKAVEELEERVATAPHEDTDELPLPEPRAPATPARVVVAKVEEKPTTPRMPVPAVAHPPATPPAPVPRPVLPPPASLVKLEAAVAPPPAATLPRKVEHRPKRATPMSPQQATHHLMLAWEKVTGHEATLEIISVLWGQWALETGRGRWMVDYNYAGLKGVAPDGGWAYWWTWEETASGPHRVRARFRNYESADRGAEDYVGLLWRLYPKAVAAAREGNAAEFIEELVDGGFFTEIPKHYKRSVISLAAEFRRDTRALRL